MFFRIDNLKKEKKRTQNRSTLFTRDRFRNKLLALTLYNFVNLLNALR